MRLDTRLPSPELSRLARGERLEISMPWLGGKLTTLSYLMPSLRRGLRDRLYAIGRRNKNKYRKA